MKSNNRLLSVLLVLVMLFALSINAFAVDYSEGESVPGLSGVQPEDTLTLPEDTVWATLTAVWGVRVIFLDWKDREIDSVVVREGEDTDTPTPPTRARYTFTGWSRVDEAEGSATLDGDVVMDVTGPGPIVYKANYKGVLADGQTSGAITVINTTHNKDYAGYKIFDALISPDDIEAVVYTIADDSPFYEYVQDYFTLTELREIPGENETVTVYEAKPLDGFDPKTFFEDLPTDGLTPDLPTQTPDRDGVITWDEVPFGYYAITSTLGSWVTVNTNNPFATVIDKNQGPTIDKNIVEEEGKVKANDAAFGDSVRFDIEVTASNYKATELVTYYHIKDTLGEGFDYDFTESGNVTVSVTGTQDPVSTTVTLSEVGSLEALEAAKSGYVFLYDENTPDSFEVVVKWATVNSAGKLMPISPDEWNTIDVTYSATVNNAAVIAGEGNPNTASFTYDRSTDFDPENPPTAEPKVDENPEDPDTPVSTTTYVYALAIEKVDAKDKTKHLPGVRFATEDFRAVKISDGIYEVIADGDTTTTAVEYFEVPSDGFILIKGLDSGEYTFKETYVLPGYNPLPAEGFKITVASAVDGGYTSGGTVYEVDCAKIETVENATGKELPETGGIGTTLFIVLGALAVLGTGVLLITNKRVKKDDGEDPDDMFM